MDKMGIECNVVTGTATNAAGTVNHAWNQVKLDGEWYFVDVSWDDPVPDWYGNVKYTYFLKSAKDFADHTWNVSNYEKCSSTKYDNSANVFWKDLTSPVYCEGGNMFYIKKKDRTAELYKRNATRDEISEPGNKIMGVEDKWYAYGSTTSFYPGNFSKLAYGDNKLFISASKQIFVYDMSKKSIKTISNLDVSKGYVYGIKYADGVLYYQTAKTPNTFDGEIKGIKFEGTQDSPTAKKKLSGTVKLSKSQYVYTGKNIKPGVSIAGLKKDVDYEVSYSNNKNVGTATVKVTGINNYEGTLKKTFKIVPKKVALSKVTSPKKKVIKATWKKVSGTGYQVVISKDKKFKNSTTYTVKGDKKLALSIKKNIISGKMYYVKVRAYKVVKGKNYTGAYSKVLNSKAK